MNSKLPDYWTGSLDATSSLPHKPVSWVELLSQMPSPLGNLLAFLRRLIYSASTLPVDTPKHTLYSKKCLRYLFYPLICELLKCKQRPLLEPWSIAQYPVERDAQ